MADKRVQNNQVVCCVTCAAIAVRKAIADGIAKDAAWKDTYIEDAVWAAAWNVSVPAEEMEMFAHAEANPKHIMVKALDFGYSVNGV